MSDMGTFRINIEIENPALPGPRADLPSVLVDTGSELSWIPAAILESLGIKRRQVSRFRQANGTILDRWTGSAWIYAGRQVPRPTTSYSENPTTCCSSARERSKGSTFALILSLNSSSMRGLHRRHAASGPREPHYFDSLAEVPLAALGSISLADTDAAGCNEKRADDQQRDETHRAKVRHTLASSLRAS
jgi:hypothetical protein